MYHLVLPIIIALAIENLRPRFKDLSSFTRIRQNLFWLLVNAIILPYLLSKASWWFGEVITAQFSSLSFDWKLLSSIPPVVQFIVAFLLLDFYRYWLHYLFHRIPFMWTFHKVHHSIEELVALSSFRQSGFEILITIFTTSTLLTLLGVNFTVLLILNLITMAICLIQHSNIKTPLMLKMESCLITPENHRIHHSRILLQKYGQNFGFCLNVWDRLFKTYVMPDQEKYCEIGIDEKNFPSRTWNQFLYPFKFF